MPLTEHGNTRVMEQGSSKKCAAAITALLLLLPPLPPCCCRCCLYLCRGSSGGSRGVAVCRHRGGDFATTVVDFVFVFVFVFFCFCFCFCFCFLLHDDGILVTHLFLAMDIGIAALSVTAAIILGAVVP
jgi:hypothetical protein